MEFVCHICGKNSLEEVEEFRVLPRVTSDCKSFSSGGRLYVCQVCGTSQKVCDHKWQAECNKIYANYTPYFQSNGIEQAVFSNILSTPLLRSDVLVNKISHNHVLNNSGCLLDVGCGNGSFMAAFSRVKANWQFYGHDLNSLNIDYLNRIPGFKKLFLGYPLNLKKSFNLISMIHALEHFDDPYQGLIDFKPYLLEDGAFFIQVPNARQTPFDLVVADHATHFSKYSLSRLLNRAQFDIKIISEEWISKELSLIAVHNRSGRLLDDIPNTEDQITFVKSQVSWLKRILEHSKKVAAKSSPFGLFGTSIASTWLYSELSSKVDFFIDEDPSRKGKTLFDKPIYAPDEVPKNSTVYLALIPNIAAKVAERLSPLEINLVCPKIL